jgi:hypothetical protein
MTKQLRGEYYKKVIAKNQVNNEILIMTSD